MVHKNFILSKYNRLFKVVVSTEYIVEFFRQFVKIFFYLFPLIYIKQFCFVLVRQDLITSFSVDFLQSNIFYTTKESVKVLFHCDIIITLF
jgi:hypothetical protein